MTASHRKSATKIYWIWCEMKQRCTNPKNKDYKNYGAKGVSVCERWTNSFESFLADMGEPQPGLTLDRIDTDGAYAPENCRWATVTVQNRNFSNSVSTTGRKCVYVDKKSGRYRAHITCARKQIYLGAFTEFADAVAARLAAEKAYWGNP